MRMVLVFLMAATVARAEWPVEPIPGGLGVNIHFTDPRPGELKIMTDAGVRWVRMDFFWDRIETTKGVYDFSKYDALVEALDEAHIRPWFILDYGNKVYGEGSPHTDEQRAAMGAFAVAAVNHFAGRPVVWEMWNEPNLKQFWKPTPNVDDYAKLSRAVGAAIRAASPKASFVGPGCSGVDLKFIEACMKAGCLDDWDAVSMHPYRQSAPETAVKDYTAARALIAKYKPVAKTIPILSGEWGYSVGWKNFSEAKQGRYLARQWLFNQWQQVPISIWYDWHDDGDDPKEPEHHFGITHHDFIDGKVYKPKPAYQAAKTMTAVLDGFTCAGRIFTAKPEDFVLAFTKGDQTRLAAWTTSDKPAEIVLKIDPDRIESITLTGEALPVVDAPAEYRLTLTADVLYLKPATGQRSLVSTATR